ncbi:helix-turn-helix domain-containing protein [Paractinoplanes atraurantiacus]|uniref:Helix-turn-helix domain-containing protein n=1 Tax=Paractinoplanes atraurantiacus TaxID=1036182 RepID=A0A285JRT7_9ACTN|nr:helix-turn-helix domain-containing protein [Actinoplanes atraurantiacus]SNY62968.1 Helix-turn-helix domain-containing protein [Actinoplanes atraurantiacus]
MESFGALLRRLRLAAGMTLEQLAAASGVSDRGIGDMERGVSRGPRVRTVEALADGLALDGEDRAALLAAARAGRTGTRRSGGRQSPPDFVGRADELARIAAWTAAGEIVVITGAPGFGKTSLALAAQGADQRIFVDLRGLDDAPLAPVDVLTALIRAADPAAKVLPRDVDEAASHWQALIRDRRAVVVLDNAIGEAQVRPALPAEGPAAVLITSRRTLGGLEGVRRLHLGPLPDGDAVALLAAIAGDREGLPAIASLCVNVPLALRIAATRLASMPEWTTGDLAARLSSHHLDALDQVKAAFTLSYQQLSDPARRLFRRLALVPGPSFGVDLAAVLAGEPADATEDLLDELVDLCLLQQEASGRLGFHDLLRAYAASALTDEEGDVAAIVERRDAWLLDATIEAGRAYEPGHDSAVPLAEAGPWLRAEAGNWLPVFTNTTDDGRVVDVAEALHWFSDTWSFWPHWEDVYSRSVQAARRLGDERLQAVHLGYLAWVYVICLAEPSRAVEYAREAVRLAGRLGDPSLIGWSNYYVAWALKQAGSPQDALPYARAAAEAMRRAGDREGLPNAVIMVATVLQDAGRDEEAETFLHGALGDLTDPAIAPPAHIALFMQISVRNILADISVAAGRWDEALDQIDAAAAAAAEMEYSPTRDMVTLSRRALILASLGRDEEARADLDALRELLEGAGDSIFGAPGAIRDRVSAAERLLSGSRAESDR